METWMIEQLEQAKRGVECQIPLELELPVEGGQPTVQDEQAAPRGVFVINIF